MSWGFVRLSMTAVAAVGLGLGALGVATGTAEARPVPVPLGSWPGCPPDHPEGPCHWCPGDPPVQTGNHITNPVVWDESVCHTYWYGYFGQGNVAQNIFEGDTPPPPPPPPPPAIIGNYDQCLQMLGPLSLFCPKA